MQVMSIRLEPELKERLRQIAGEHAYQTLIRDVLWQFVEHTNFFLKALARAAFKASEKRCANFELMVSRKRIYK